MLRMLRIKVTPSLTDDSYTKLMRARKPWEQSSVNPVLSLPPSSIRSGTQDVLIRDYLLRSQHHVRPLDYGTSRAQRPRAPILPVSQSWPENQAHQTRITRRWRGCQAAPPSLWTDLYCCLGILLLVAGVGAFLYGVYLGCLWLIEAFGAWLAHLPAIIARGSQSLAC